MWKSTDLGKIQFLQISMKSADFQKKIDVSPLKPQCGMKTNCPFY